MSVRDLHNRGFALLPPAVLPSAAMTREVLRGMSADDKPCLREWRLHAPKTGWNEAVGKTLPGFRRVKAFTNALTRLLRAELPGEAFELDIVHLRLTRRRPAYTSHPHFDSDYLTASCALEGGGTTLYWRDAKGVHARTAPDGSTAVITSARREAATGVETTIHSAPLGTLDRRVVLIIFYSRKGLGPGRPLRDKLKAKQAFFQRHFDAPDPERTLRP